MRRPSRPAIWTIGASLVVAAVVGLGVSSAQGAPAATAKRPPKPRGDSCYQTWNPQLNNFNAPVMNAGRHDTQNCLDQRQGQPVWTQSAGVINGTLDGHVYTGSGDALRVATTGQLRLYRPDIAYMETGSDAAEVAAQKQYGGPLIAGEVEVAPAPIAVDPPKPGDNSLGWMTSNGPSGASSKT